MHLDVFLARDATWEHIQSIHEPMCSNSATVHTETEEVNVRMHHWGALVLEYTIHCTDSHPADVQNPFGTKPRTGPTTHLSRSVDREPVRHSK